MHRVLDTSPLEGSVDERAVEEFNRAARGRGGGSGGTNGMGFAAGAFLLALCVVVVWAAFAVLFAVATMILYSFGVEIPIGGAGFPAAVGAVLTVSFIALRVWRASRENRATSYRISQFAAANGLSYEARVDDPELPGMIFNQGVQRYSSDIVQLARPRSIAVANHGYSEPGKNQHISYAWGYLAITLDRHLPHIVLDAAGNNSMLGTNLPATFGRKQRLSLEGDFDKHFALYCPEGSEADALYLFTPDIMATFIDSAARFDVEIIDDRMFLYSRQPLSTADPAVWESVFTTIDAVTAKLDQWERWSEGLAGGTLDPELRSVSSAAHSLDRASPIPLNRAPRRSSRGRRLRRRMSVFDLLPLLGPLVAIVLFLLAAA